MMKEISPLAAILSKVYSNYCVRSTTISAIHVDSAGIPIYRIMQTSARVVRISRTLTDKAWKSTKNPPIFLLKLVTIPLLRPAQ